MSDKRNPQEKYSAEELAKHLSGENSDDGWSTIWPREEGYYWFYGWHVRPESKSVKPTMALMNIVLDRDRYFYVADGHYVFKQDGAFGFFKKAELPDPPEEHIEYPTC